MLHIKRSLLTVLTAGALSLAACGGSSDPAASETADGGSETTVAVEIAEGTEAVDTTAGDSASGASAEGGPAGIDVSQAQLCRLVGENDLKTLFGDLEFKAPDYSTNSCGLFATVNTNGLSPSLSVMPIFVPFADQVATQKELGAVAESLPGIGDEAAFVTLDIENFAPSRTVYFRKGDVTYSVQATYVGVTPVDPAAAKSVLVPIAERYAATV
jgi:hypothetical protein